MDATSSSGLYGSRDAPPPAPSPPPACLAQREGSVHGYEEQLAGGELAGSPRGGGASSWKFGPFLSREEGRKGRVGGGRRARMRPGSGGRRPPCMWKGLCSVCWGPGGRWQHGVETTQRFLGQHRWPPDTRQDFLPMSVGTS